MVVVEERVDRAGSSAEAARDSKPAHESARRQPVPETPNGTVVPSPLVTPGPCVIQQALGYGDDGASGQRTRAETHRGV